MSAKARAAESLVLLTGQMLATNDNTNAAKHKCIEYFMFAVFKFTERVVRAGRLWQWWMSCLK
jgi:hypothetical protein